MLVVLFLFCSVLLLFLYLFFAPFYLEVNSIDGLYRARFHRLASISMKAMNGSLFAEIKIIGLSKQIDLFSDSTVSKARPIEKENKIKTKKNEIPWRKIKGVLKSFKINVCSISIDSGNMQLNGILFPVFYGLSVYTGKNIQINFIEQNSIILEMENSLARMSWAYLSS